MRIRLRPSIPSDLGALELEPLPHRIRAITALAGERVIGVGGIGYRPDGTVIAFVQMTDEARTYPTAIHRAGLAAMAMIRSSRVPMVLAEAKADNPAAARWLLRLGFKPLERDGRQIELDGRKAYVWRR